MTLSHTVEALQITISSITCTWDWQMIGSSLYLFYLVTLSTVDTKRVKENGTRTGVQDTVGTCISTIYTGT